MFFVGDDDDQPVALQKLRSIVVTDWCHSREFIREVLDELCPEALMGKSPILENYMAIAMFLFRQQHKIPDDATLKVSATWW